MINDPENPGRRLYADLTIVERVTAGENGAETEVLDIEVDDVTTEAHLSAAISASLHNVKIEPDRLNEVLKTHYRLFHINDELYNDICKHLYNEPARP